MTSRAYSVEAVRSAERPLIEAAAAAGDPDAVMRRAAAGLAHHTAALLRERTGGLYGRSVLLLVGSGDNGGDALYAGAMLRQRGCRVDAVLLDPARAHARGLAALRRAGGRAVDAGAGLGSAAGRASEARIAPNPLPGMGIRYPSRGSGSAGGVADFGRGMPDVAVDGIVGLGGSGPLREPAGQIVTALAEAGVPWVAVDLPSGVDADTGTVHTPHVPATLTVTFGMLRRAHLLASPACGRVEVVDIGLTEPDVGPDAGRDAEPRAGLRAEQSAAPGVILRPSLAEVGRAWPVPGPADDKYSQGVVAIRAGSEKYPGAAVLSVSAAVAATSGMVRYVGSGADRVLAARPEVVCHPSVAEAGTAQAWVVGPGAGTGPEGIADIDAVLAHGRPTLLDADALTCIAAHPVLLRSATAPVLLTPHGGEFDRLTGGWDRADRAGALRRYVAGLRERGIEATVLLKGRVTLIDDGQVTYAVDAGSSWAATAGSGDVLAGVAGALIAHAATGSSTSQAGTSSSQADQSRSPAGPSPSLAWPAAAAVILHGHAAHRAAYRAAHSRDLGPGGPGAPIGASDLLAALPGAIADLRAR